MKELYQALMAARKELTGGIYKGAKNSAQNYSYLGHEKVLEVTRPVLLDHGLLLLEVSVVPTGATEGDKRYPTWEGKFALIHAESGQAMELKFSATTVGNDKAAYVASTALERTALLRILAIAGSSDKDTQPFVEDPESDHSGTDATVREQAPSSKPGISGARQEFGQLYGDVRVALEKLEACRSLSDVVGWFAVLDDWEPPKLVYDECMGHGLTKAFQMCQSPADLEAWFRRLEAWRVDPQDKSVVGKSFAATAKRLGVNYSDIVAKVRGTQTGARS